MRSTNGTSQKHSSMFSVRRSKPIPPKHGNIRERLNTYSLTEIFGFAEVNKPRDVLARTPKIYYTDTLGNRMSLRRAFIYLKHGTQCCCCPARGEFFALEKWGDNSLHLELYATVDGKEVLMTVDHIIPRSKGGRDTIKNYQPMCKICNETKGSGVTT